MQTDAEHQEDYPDFGKLERKLRIRDKTRSVGTDGYPGKEIADERRQPQTMGHKTECESEHQTDDDRGD